MDATSNMGHRERHSKPYTSSRAKHACVSDLDFKRSSFRFSGWLILLRIRRRNSSGLPFRISNAGRRMNPNLFQYNVEWIQLDRTLQYHTHHYYIVHIKIFVVLL